MVVVLRTLFKGEEICVEWDGDTKAVAILQEIPAGHKMVI